MLKCSAINHHGLLQITKSSLFHNNRIKPECQRCSINSQQRWKLQAVDGHRRAAVLSLCSKIFRGLSNKSCPLWRSTVLLICSRDSHYTNKTDRQTDSELLQGQFATMRRKLGLFFFFHEPCCPSAETASASDRTRGYTDA